MADSERSDQERNLPPSAKRLEDARREGQVPRSRDLAHLLVLGGAAAVLFALWGSLASSALKLMARGLRFDAALATDPTLMGTRLAELAFAALVAVAPVLGALLLAAVAAPLAIGGWMFSMKPLEFKLERIDPLAGFGRMFSLHAVVELAKVMLVAVLLALVGAWFLANRSDELVGLAHQDLPAALNHFGGLMALAFALMVATLAVSSAIDVPFQLFQHHSKLKMSLEEVRREEKETQGDPHIKARIRNQQRELARRRMMSAVPTANVVVTNPTHYAVALKYAEGRSRAPIVVAKGADEVAAKIRELARAHGVPQLEAPPLARALHRHVEIGGEIPAALYGAVAQVLAYVFQLQAFAAGRAPRPTEPRELDVAGLDPAVARATA